MPRAATGPRSTLAAVAVAVAALVSGCVLSTESPREEQARADPIDRVNREEFDADVSGAVAATDGFWRRTFADEFGRSYRPPRVAGGYLGENGPSCAGEPSVPFNAIYCPAADFIAWDETLMAAGYRADRRRLGLPDHRARVGPRDPGPAATRPGVGGRRAAGRLPGRRDHCGAAPTRPGRPGAGRHRGAGADPDRGGGRLPVDRRAGPRERPAADQRLRHRRPGRGQRLRVSIALSSA